jgi:hypothetical protein
MEVYLYDAVAKHLACVSCNPTGARPVGVEVENFSIFGAVPRSNLVAVIGGSGETYSGQTSVAANLDPGTPLGGYSESLYLSRALSDSGRVFFNSSDALVPQDINGNEDVYEYEPAGVGNCTGSSYTYRESSGGCVDLISSGTSAEESAFLDASETGNDVFFLTSERLVTQDYDSAIDVYDAHVCTATAPCSSEPASAAPCTTADACRAAPAAPPTVFGATPSETFSGNGNPAPTLAPKPSACPRGKCRKAHSRRHRRKPRRGHAKHKRTARKRG